VSGTLEGKVALITGAGRGIGRATALKLAGRGARVVVNDFDETPALDTVEAIRQAGGTAVACVGSVIDPAFADRFIQTALDQWGGLDIIINNAGYTWDSPIEQCSDEQFDRMYDVNVKAHFRILRAAAGPIMAMHKREAAEGRSVVRKIVNISSMSGTGGSPGQIAYATAKSAVVGFTKTMAKEWGQYNVCVNCVAFGLIETRLTQVSNGGGETIGIDGKDIRIGLDSAVLDAVRAGVPLGRPGTPEDAAGGVYLLCLPESDYITGQTLLVGGGLANA
jgi:3-oxoacyl-[acyl-carrier protein] reductase